MGEALCLVVRVKQARYGQHSDRVHSQLKRKPGSLLSLSTVDLALVESSEGRAQQRQQRRRRSRCRGLLRHTDCYSGQVSGGREAVVGAALPIVVAGWLLSGVRWN